MPDTRPTDDIVRGYLAAHNEFTNARGSDALGWTLELFKHCERQLHERMGFVPREREYDA